MSTQVPGQEQFDAAAEMVSGVPFVGGSMASAMTEKVEEVAQAFLDALIAVATDPGCIKAFLDPILSIDLDDAMAICCVEINQCVGCTRQFFTKSFLGDDAAVLAPSSGEEPASPRHRAGVASMAWRTTRRFRTNAP